jgi:hypothetical protein
MCRVWVAMPRRQTEAFRLDPDRLALMPGAFCPDLGVFARNHRTSFLGIPIAWASGCACLISSFRKISLTWSA